jgi:hypothetical protein
MTGEFPASKVTRIFIYIFMPMLIALFAWVGYIGIYPDTADITVGWILIPVSLVGIVGFSYGIVETIKGRIVIDEQSVSRISTFGTRTLTFQEIKGFRVTDQGVILEPNVVGMKSITISQYTEKYKQIVAWLYGSFVELDTLEASQEEEQILTDEALGLNRQGNEYRLAEARRIARYLNIVGGVVAGWLWFYPHPYDIAGLVAIAVPLLSLGAVYLYRGFIRFDQRNNSAYPSMFFGFMLPGMGLLIRAVLDFEIMEYGQLWMVVVLVTVVIAAVLMLGTRELKFKKRVEYFTAVAVAGIVLAYVFGAYVFANCVFDASAPQVFTAEVVGKEISSDNVTTYYLVVNPWGPRTEAERISVSEEDYEVVQEGDPVDIYFMQGLFKTPWFYLSQHEAI